ncbi:MAG: sigma-70 family RNA polymerase sigma factor, partial [Abditibacteriales bacterium]|nr:sigma-70 family RNA polymerase sigma factor [Abditibacteriales bacterium]
RAVATCMRRRRRQAGREVAWSDLAITPDPEAWTEAVEETLRRLGSAEWGERSRASDPAEQVVERLVLQQALQSLSPRQRDVFTLREMVGYSHGEIGEQLGISASSVRTHYQKAREKLRKSLREKSAED